MSESFIQLPADSTGKKLRTRQRSISGQTVEEQAVMLAGMDTWWALADNVVPAANKHHIAILNGAGSGVVIRIRKLFVISLQIAAVTGAVMRCDIKKTTAQSGGTAITPQSMDSNNVAIPAQVLIATAPASVTEGAILFPTMITAEEEPATQALSKSQFQAYNNLILEGPEMQELVLREGQGLTVKQITSVAVGSLAWLMGFTVE